MEYLISIIIPVYNAKRYLDKCLNSVLNQSYKNLEIIVIDDGSTDGSAQLCDQFAEKDNRIIVIHKQNEGQSVARNIGLNMAKGDFIGFVDSDDHIDEYMYEVLLCNILDSSSDICQIGHYLVYPKKDLTRQTHVIYFTNILLKLFQKLSFFSCQSKGYSCIHV